MNNGETKGTMTDDLKFGKEKSAFALDCLRARTLWHHQELNIALLYFCRYEEPKASMLKCK